MLEERLRFNVEFSLSKNHETDTRSMMVMRDIGFLRLAFQHTVEYDPRHMKVVAKDGSVGTFTTFDALEAQYFRDGYIRVQYDGKRDPSFSFFDMQKHFE